MSSFGLQSPFLVNCACTSCLVTHGSHSLLETDRWVICKACDEHSTQSMRAEAAPIGNAKFVKGMLEEFPNTLLTHRLVGVEFPFGINSMENTEASLLAFLQLIFVQFHDKSLEATSNITLWM